MLNWVDVVGYQYEFVHTGVLRALLDDDRYGVAIAQELTGSAAIAEVVSVAAQGHAGGRPGTRADLVAVLHMTDGSQQMLAVETKTDSAASRRQMEGTAGEDHFACLLAVGLTSLQLSDLRPGAWGSETWTVSDLSDWARVLRACGPLDPPLDAYVERVERELRDHDDARAAALVADTGASDRSRTGQALSDWAWMSAISEAVAEAGAGSFWCLKLISGPVMYWHDSAASIPGGGHLYLDFMIENGVRRLVLKGGDVPVNMRKAVWDAGVAGVGREATRSRGRPAAGRTGSFKIAAIDLIDMPIEKIVETAVRFRGRLPVIAASVAHG